MTGRLEAFYDYGADSEPLELNGEFVWRQTFIGYMSRLPHRLLSRASQVPYYNVELYAGSDRTLRLYVRDQDDNIVDLTGATCKFTMRRTKDGPILVQKSTAVPAQGQIGSADRGEVLFYLIPSDTSSLDVYEQYVFDMHVQVASGKQATVLEGLIDLKQPVT